VRPTVEVDGVGLVWVEVPPVGRLYQFKLQLEMELRIEVMRFHFGSSYCLPGCNRSD
jgi:hypothetical protein